MRPWSGPEHDLATALVRGVGRVVVRLALRHDTRRPLGWVTEELLDAMAAELQRQGVSSRVAAGMFGVSYRTWLRRTQAARVSRTPPASSTWWRVREQVRSGVRDRIGLGARNPNLPPDVLASVLRDLLDSGWITETRDGLKAGLDAPSWTDEQLDAFVFAHRFFAGTADLEQLQQATGFERRRLEASLKRTATQEVLDHADHDARLSLLHLLTDRFLKVVHGKLGPDDTADRVHLWSLRHAPGDVKPVEGFRAAVAEQLAGVRQAYRAAADAREDVPPDAPTYLVGVIETEGEADGWATEGR